MTDLATIEPQPLVLSLPQATSYEQWIETGQDLGILLRYEPGTGKLFWRPRHRSLFKSDRSWKTWNARYAGREAFTALSGHGYFHGAIFGRTVKAHRVAWAIVHGAWPENGIDHIDGNRTNNRLANLRDVPQAENRKNAALASNNHSGITGVHWCNTWKRWIAKIKVNGKTKTLGQFANIEDAAAARARASEEMGFMPRHGTGRRA